MNTPKRLIFDIEKYKGGIAYKSDSGEEVDIVSGGKEIIPVPKNEQDHKIYKLLAEHCDVIFCTTPVLDDFLFYPIPSLWIFAIDSNDNCFGTIGGMGDIINNNYPVGYVNRNGLYGKIANNLKEFLSLATFYPYWWDIVRHEQMGVAYDINAMEIEKIENNPIFLERQLEIQELLNISKNPNSIELLKSNIKSSHDFMVYTSKEEAQKSNTFLDTTKYWSELEKQKEILRQRVRKI